MTWQSAPRLTFRLFHAGAPARHHSPQAGHWRIRQRLASLTFAPLPPDYRRASAVMESLSEFRLAGFWAYDGQLGRNPIGRKARSRRKCAVEYAQKLCHNCETKPAFAGKTDFFDKVGFVDSAQLIEGKNLPEDSGLRAHPLFFLCVIFFATHPLHPNLTDDRRVDGFSASRWRRRRALCGVH